MCDDDDLSVYSHGCMTPEAFESNLRNLDRVATLVRRRADRETWRFAYADKPYYLHFYPQGSRLAASGAPKEYAGLKTLQDFKIPAVKVVALMSGFRFGDRKGNAVITHGMEPAQRLCDATLTRAEHKQAVDQIAELLKQMTRHDLGHAALSLSSFLWHDGKVILLDAAGLKSEVLTTQQLMQFAHNVEPFASKSDRMRVWRALLPDQPIPQDRRRLKRYAADLNSDAIAPIACGEWHGWFKQQHDRPLAHSIASRLEVDHADWQREWALLEQKLRADQLDILKRDRSGDILATQITLLGHPIDVIVKRPRHKYWYRHLLGAFRASRAKRLWDKTRWLLVRRIAVEYPLIVMQRRVLGYVVESVAVFERVPGMTLDHADLNVMTDDNRENFFRSCGRILRKIEDTGLTHTDAKSSNWIVYNPDDGNAEPVLIDCYGIRRFNLFLQLFGIRRLLRAMKDHPAYTPTDSLHICLGFAPRSSPEVEA